MPQNVTFNHNKKAMDARSQTLCSQHTHNQNMWRKEGKKENTELNKQKVQNDLVTSLIREACIPVDGSENKDCSIQQAH